MLWLLQSGSAMTSRRESFANFLVDAAKVSRCLVAEDLEVKLTFSSAVIRLLPNLSCSNTFTKLLPEEFTHQEKAALQLVLQFTLPKTQRQKKSSSSQERWCSQIVVSAASTNSTRWTTTQESSCTRPWNSRQSLLLKLVSLLLLTAELQFSQLPTQ